MTELNIQAIPPLAPEPEQSSRPSLLGSYNSTEQDRNSLPAPLTTRNSETETKNENKAQEDAVVQANAERAAAAEIEPQPVTDPVELAYNTWALLRPSTQENSTELRDENSDSPNSIGSSGSTDTPNAFASNDLPSGLHPMTDVVRASQMNAQAMDDDALDILTQQLRAVFKYHSGGDSFMYHYSPELEAFFRVFIFRSTVMRDLPTPGAAMQNLVYKSTDLPPYLVMWNMVKKIYPKISVSNIKDMIQAARNASTTSTPVQNLEPSPSSFVKSAISKMAATSQSVQHFFSQVLNEASTLNNEVKREIMEVGLEKKHAYESILRSEEIMPFEEKDKMLYTVPAPSAELKLPSKPLLRPSQKFLFFMVHIVMRWGWVRLGTTLQSMSYGSGLARDRPRLQTFAKKALVWFNKFELGFRWLEFINFLLFLSKGQYLSLADRFLGIRLQYPRPNARRAIALDLLHQQLLWQGILDFIIFVMPLINVRSITSFFKRVFFLGHDGESWTGSHSSSASSLSFQSGSEQSMDRVERQQYLQSSCGICGTKPMITPHRATCGHIFCYYCIYARRLSYDKGTFACPECLAPISSQSPLK